MRKASKAWWLCQGCVCSNIFYQQEPTVGKPDVLSGTVRLLAHLQPGFPKVLSTEEDTKGLQLPVLKLVGKGKALALIFEQVNISKLLKKGTYLQITDQKERKKEKGRNMQKRRSGSPFQWQTLVFSLGESSPYSTKIPFNFLHVAVRLDVSAQNKRQSTEETTCPGPQQPAGINCTSS